MHVNYAACSKACSVWETSETFPPITHLIDAKSVVTARDHRNRYHEGALEGSDERAALRRKPEAR